MYHLELDLSFLLYICRKVVSLSQSSDPFNKLIWCLTSFEPDLFQLVDHWETGWSMELCKNSIKSLALFLFFSHSSTVVPEGFYCSWFLHPMGPKKLSRYSSYVVSPSLSGIPWSVYQFSISLMKSQKSLYYSDEFQFKVGGFRESVSDPLCLSKPLLKSWWWPHSHVPPLLQHSYQIVEREYLKNVC